MSEPIVAAQPRPVRRRLQRLVRRSPTDGSGRRANAILLLLDGVAVSVVAVALQAARSSIYRWVGWFESGSAEGLTVSGGGRPPWTVAESVVELLKRLLSKRPHEFDYNRSTWTSEMLASQVQSQLGVAIHPSTVRRVLPAIGYGWRRPRPVLYRRDPHKRENLEAIAEVVRRRERGVAVFYVDEVDIHPLPKIGFTWAARGQQPSVLTPGCNQKRYLAGALNAHTGTITYAESTTKGSALFISLLRALRKRYRGFRTLVLILDNFVIHKSRDTQRWLARNSKFALVFQPVYCHTANRIERLWKALHDSVTRNHCWATMDYLMVAMRRFLEVAAPFPGNQHALARLA